MSKSPADMITGSNHMPLYNSGILGNYIHYLEAHHTDVDTDALLNGCGLTRFDINDQGQFLTQTQINHFHRSLDEELADPDISYKVGRHALYTKSSGTMRRYGLQFITPETLYKAVDRLYPKWSKGHVSKTTITGKGRAEVTVSVRPSVREEPFQCQNRQGILEAIGELLTGKPAQISHPTCMHRSDDVCHYLISWQNKPSAAWKRAGAYLNAFFLAMAVTTPFFMPADDWAFLVLAMGVVGLSVLHLGNRLEKKELLAFLKEQGDSAGQLLEELETRYHNSQLIQEIGQAGSDILEIDTFLNTVLASMSRNLDFTRGIIALCNDGCTRLKLVADYGFSPKEWEFLDRMEFEIDLENPSDMFIESLRSGRPVFLDHIQGKTDDMTPNSLAVIENLNVDALISAPLVYKKEKLGLLFVDTKDAKRDHTTSDVNLLMGIASQIAIGIVNARSFSRMQESEQRYRLLAENVTDVIWIMDIETQKMKYVSPSVEKSQGYTPDEVRGMSIDQYLTPESFQRAATALGETLELAAAGQLDPASYSIRLELEEYHQDGSIIPIEVTASLLLDGNGQPDAVLGITRDLSDRKRADQEKSKIENRLQQARKMESLGTMAGSIAHNFNNLLMVVLGNLELASDDLAETSTASSSVKRAINASKRAADLSNMMLTYVGQLKRESLPVDLSQLVTTELKKMDESTMDHVTLDLDLADPMPLVAADADQMRQMISGFITNAIEALGEKKGRVRIATGSMHCDRNYLSTTYLKEDMLEGMYAYVEVADTGCGMDKETLGKVFDPFFSTKFTGRGLGMAAVMGIIRSHGGVVKVSSAKNEGSVFTALFPIQGISLGQATPDREKREKEATGKTVLLVDDEEMVMDIGSQFLERLGYQVKRAASGQAAVDIFEQNPDGIDCLLLDFTMPGMDGLETMQRIKAIRPDASIIITSGYTRQQIEDRFARVGLPDGFIHKPFEMKVLQEKINKTLSKDQ